MSRETKWKITKGIQIVLFLLLVAGFVYLCYWLWDSGHKADMKVIDAIERHDCEYLENHIIKFSSSIVQGEHKLPIAKNYVKYKCSENFK